jgi:hypothetical protein
MPLPFTVPALRGRASLLRFANHAADILRFCRQDGRYASERWDRFIPNLATGELMAVVFADQPNRMALFDICPA